MSNLQPIDSFNIKQYVRYKGGLIDQLEVTLDWTICASTDRHFTEKDITYGIVLLLDKVKKMFGPVPIKIGSQSQPLETFINEALDKLNR